MRNLLVNLQVNCFQTTGQLPASVLFKRAADNETCLMENGFLVESKKQRLNKDDGK